MESFSVYIIPVVICIIIVFGLFKRVPLFDTFIAGAKEGFQSSISILPSLVGLIMAVTMLSASGALELFTNWIAGCRFFRFPGTGTSACLASPNFRQRFHCGFNRNLPKLRRRRIYRTCCFCHDGFHGNHILCHCRVLWFSGHKKDTPCNSCSADGGHNRIYYVCIGSKSIFSLIRHYLEYLHGMILTDLYDRKHRV